MFIPAALVIASLASAQPSTSPFALKDGDRIAWIGNTLVEREQRYGYWEAALLAAFPDKKITFRNLGWSGDTVFGEARGRFDFNNPNACLTQLVSLTLELKPTVIFVSYGTNESFEGEAGLAKFEKGLEKLLDALKPAKARIVLFSPLRVQAHAGSPKPEIRNAMLARYRDAIRSVAQKRGVYFADLFETIGPLLDGATNNGMHLTSEGYKQTARGFLASLGLEFRGSKPETTEALRKVVVAKDQLFFYKWRPQNETYLTGFRKHEQGKNAKEVVEFDPLIAKAEQQITDLLESLAK